MKQVGSGAQESRAKSGQGRLAVIVIAAVLIVDQLIKYFVKTRMYLGEQIRITDWFYILFVENNGMAFGMEIVGKLFLSVFRIAAIGLFVWYLLRILNRKYPTGYIVCIALVIAGAAGNLLDCIFYGLIYTESGRLPEQVATLTAIGQGYAPALYGKVVDMFYFPLWRWPDWVPLMGGDIFFSPVFNFADSCITCGMIAIVLFYSKCFNGSPSADDRKQKDGQVGE